MKKLTLLFFLFLLTGGCTETSSKDLTPVKVDNPASIVWGKVSTEETKLNSSEEYNVRQIVVRKKEDAEQIINYLNDGANFVELANEKSIAPSKAFWFAPDKMNKSFSDATAQLGKGSYTKEAVQTLPNTWHVILLEDIR